MKFLTILIFALATAAAVPIEPRDLFAPAANEERITNGKDAAEGQFPYQVALQFKSSSGMDWFCGGSLIGEDNTAKWILTAAHCTSASARYVKVSMGAIRFAASKYTQTIPSSNFIQHPGYNSLALYNDISLIKLVSAVPHSSEIQTIALPKISSSYSNYDGDSVTVSGWGLTKDGNTDVSPIMQYASLKVISNEECEKTYGYIVVTPKKICAATPNGTSTCSGDSGGPMVEQKSKQLIGVTSFVNAAGCQSGAPAGFIRVTAYLDWIKENTGLQL